MGRGERARRAEAWRRGADHARHLGLGDRVLEPFDPADARGARQAHRRRVHRAAARRERARGQALCDAGVRVVDLSADFRLKNRDAYSAWYGEHGAPELLGEAVYGLPELHRDGASRRAPDRRARVATRRARSLPLAPLLAADLVEKHGIVIDAKSGVSGAGRSPGPAYHFPEAAEGLRPYKVAGTHRHTARNRARALAQRRQRHHRHVHAAARADEPRHPACTYATARAGTTAEVCREAARELYRRRPGHRARSRRAPDTLWVRGSARAHVAYALDERAGSCSRCAPSTTCRRGPRHRPSRR